jgi:hypothetical protein
VPIDYFERLPLLLREEFAAGRWLPVIGAGISANAITRGGKPLPTWTALGDAVRLYLPTGYGVDGPVDALSTYEQMHGRPALVDRVHEALMIDQAQPGEVHKAFAKIPFDSVLTTNVDFLLEAAWTANGWPFDPVVGEQRLTAKRRPRSTQLIKFHGDMHHPNELVLTEEDYDAFLARFPLLATYVASLLITRVPVLFGYSLDDPDFRAILQLIGDRLGRNRPAPWVVLARATQAQVARYERRGVRVVVLDTRSNTSHGAALTALFQRLADQLPGAAAAQAESSEDQVLAEVRLTGRYTGTLALFLGPNEYLAQHRELLFPRLRVAGLTPATPDEIQSRPELVLASLTQVIRRAAIIVVDVRGSGRGQEELSFALAQRPQAPILLIDDERSDELPVGPPVAGQVIYVPVTGQWDDELVEVAVARIVSAAQQQGSRASRVLSRLESGDVAFAFLEAVIAVESLLRSSGEKTLRSSFRQLLQENPSLSTNDAALLQQAYALRSELLHRGVEPPAAKARQMTGQLLELLCKLDG